MNEDTKELMIWCESEDKYRWSLCEMLGNELAFYHRLYRAVLDINKTLGYFAIDSSKVNPNEIYLEMNELFGNED